MLETLSEGVDLNEVTLHLLSIFGLLPSDDSVERCDAAIYQNLDQIEISGGMDGVLALIEDIGQKVGDWFGEIVLSFSLGGLAVWHKVWGGRKRCRQLSS